MFRLSEFTPKRIKIWMIAGIQLSDDLFFYLLVCESQLSYLRFPVWSWNTWIKQTTETKKKMLLTYCLFSPAQVAKLFVLMFCPDFATHVALSIRAFFPAAIFPAWRMPTRSMPFAVCFWLRCLMLVTTLCENVDWLQPLVNRLVMAALFVWLF